MKSNSLSKIRLATQLGMQPFPLAFIDELAGTARHPSLVVLQLVGREVSCGDVAVQIGTEVKRDREEAKKGV